jgi:hypothetical protein
MLNALDDPAEHIVSLACTATGSQSRSATIQSCVSFIEQVGAQAGSKAKRLILLDASGFEMKALTFDGAGNLATKWVRIHSDSAGTIRILHPHSGVSGRSDVTDVFLFLMDGDANHLAVLGNGSTIHPHSKMHAVVTQEDENDAMELWIPSPMVTVEIHKVTRQWYDEWRSNSGANNALYDFEPVWRGNSSTSDWMYSNINSAAAAAAILNAIPTNLYTENTSSHCWLAAGLCINNNENEPWTMTDLNGPIADNETVIDSEPSNDTEEEGNSSVVESENNTLVNNLTIDNLNYANQTANDSGETLENFVSSNNSSNSAIDVDDIPITVVPEDDMFTITMPKSVAQMIAVSIFWILIYSLKRRLGVKKRAILPLPPPPFLNSKIEILPPPPKEKMVNIVVGDDSDE